MGVDERFVSPRLDVSTVEAVVVVTIVVVVAVDVFVVASEPSMALLVFAAGSKRHTNPRCGENDTDDLEHLDRITEHRPRHGRADERSGREDDLAARRTAHFVTQNPGRHTRNCATVRPFE